MHLTRSQVVNKLMSVEDMKIRKVKEDGRKLDKIFFHGEPVGTLYTYDMSLSADIDIDMYGLTAIDFEDDNASDLFDEVVAEEHSDSLERAERRERLERVRNMREYFNSRKTVAEVIEEQYMRIK